MPENKDTGPVRKILIMRSERLHIIQALIGTLSNPGGGAASRNPGDRQKRKALMSALRQFGAMDIWNMMRDAPNGQLLHKDIKARIPYCEVREVSIDAIATLRANLETLDMTSALNLADLEDNLEAAASGYYELPDNLPEEPRDPLPAGT